MDEPKNLTYECGLYEMNRVIKYRFKNANNPLTYDDFIEFLISEKSEAFLKVLTGALKDATSKLSAYLWECAPVSNDTKGTTQFEFTATKSTELSKIKQDFSSFWEHISKNRREYACSFQNIGGDATLIVPIPIGVSQNKYLDYKNISNFTENAELNQRKYFWKKVAIELSKDLESDGKPRWLSTNGLGVHYLHIRIDKKPKYYSFENYTYWKADESLHCNQNKKFDDITDSKSEEYKESSGAEVRRGSSSTDHEDEHCSKKAKP